MWPPPSGSIRHLAFTVALLSLGTASAPGQQHSVNVTDLMLDTQKETPNLDRITTVWWLPGAYWTATLGEEEAQEILEVLDPYEIFGVVDGPIGPFGGVDFRSREAISAELELIDEDGAVHQPLGEEDVDPDAISLLSMMRPAIGNLLGPMGQNLHFFIFPGQKDGRPVLDPKEEGSFRVVVGDEEFHWRLPLGSLLPPRYCPVDGEELSGAWNYCPWHGAELELTPP